MYHHSDTASPQSNVNHVKSDSSQVEETAKIHWCTISKKNRDITDLGSFKASLIGSIAQMSTLSPDLG
jgi:hypothetical protein